MGLKAPDPTPAAAAERWRPRRRVVKAPQTRAGRRRRIAKAARTAGTTPAVVAAKSPAKEAQKMTRRSREAEPKSLRKPAGGDQSDSVGMMVSSLPYVGDQGGVQQVNPKEKTSGNRKRPSDMSSKRGSDHSRRAQGAEPGYYKLNIQSLMKTILVGIDTFQRIHAISLLIGAIQTSDFQFLRNYG